MALLRVFQDCEYRPDHDILIVGDTEGGGPVSVRVGALLNGCTFTGHQVVRLESHDAAPDLDLDSWADVVEAPLAPVSGAAGATDPELFRLDVPGLHRVRVASRPVADGAIVRLQIWAVDAPAEPRRWLVRGKRAATARPDRSARQAPWGAPPRAGVVGPNGEVIVWRDGEPVEIARWSAETVSRAFGTPFGIVLCGADQIMLVHPDGGIQPLGTHMGWWSAVDPAGRLLATVETRTGRWSSSRLHLIDLSDGSRETMPWPNEDTWFSVIAVRDGTVYANTSESNSTTVRWTPGSAPERMGHTLRRIDPYTGAALATDGQPGVVLLQPDGATRRLDVDVLAALTPGATHVYSYRYQPPALQLIDLSGPLDRPTTYRLPGDGQGPPAGSGGPVWESRTQLLTDLGAAGVVRLDIATGRCERVPLPPRIGRPAIVVQPCADARTS